MTRLSTITRRLAAKLGAARDRIESNGDALGVSAAAEVPRAKKADADRADRGNGQPMGIDVTGRAPPRHGPWQTLAA